MPAEPSYAGWVPSSCSGAVEGLELAGGGTDCSLSSVCITIFTKVSAVMPAQLPFSQLQSLLMDQRQLQLSPWKIDSLGLFEAGSCCFPLSYLPDKTFLMLLSLLWLQHDPVCCTLCPAGVTLVAVRGLCPVCHTLVVAFLLGATLGVLQFCTHKGLLWCQVCPEDQLKATLWCFSQGVRMSPHMATCP